MLLFELLKLSIVFGLPLYWLLSNNHDRVIFWICATLGVDLLIVNFVGDIRPMEAVGLLYLPSALFFLDRVIAVPMGKFLIVSVVLLGGLGLLFGYLLPWPDTTGVRPWNQQSQGRSLIYMANTLATVSIVIYIGRQVARGFDVWRIMRYLVIGSSVVSAGVIVQAIIGFDYYGYVEYGGGPVPDLGRLRGLSAEPRTAGQYIALGLLVMLLTRAPVKYPRLVLALHATALLLTVSTSAMLILFVGLIFSVLKSTKAMKTVVSAAVVSIGSGLIIRSLMPHWFTFWEDMVRKRLLDPDPYARATSLTEEVAMRLEVFDGSAFLFFVEHPAYLLFGTGPGLISLPASSHIPRGTAALTYGDRIDSVPHMGLMLEVSNAGLLGLGLWCGLIVTAYIAIKRCARGSSSQEDADKWEDVANVLLVFSALYLIQVKPVIFIVLGVSLGAALMIRFRHYPVLLSPVKQGVLAHAGSN